MKQNPSEKLTVTYLLTESVFTKVRKWTLPEPDESSPHSPVIFKLHFNSILPFTATVPKLFSDYVFILISSMRATCLLRRRKSPVGFICTWRTTIIYCGLLRQEQ